MRVCLTYAMEVRRRVKEQLKKLGGLEFFDVNFSYIDNETITLDMPTTSNVLPYFTEDNTKISIRPSGTEPKIKFYCEVHSKVKSLEDLPEANKAAEEKINQIKASLGI